jgi:hypothetical protein
VERINEESFNLLVTVFRVAVRLWLLCRNLRACGASGTRANSGGRIYKRNHFVDSGLSAYRTVCRDTPSIFAICGDNRPFFLLAPHLYVQRFLDRETRQLSQVEFQPDNPVRSDKRFKG